MRVCLWFGFNGLGGIWANAMAYGLYIRKDSYSIEAWRVLFIVTGLITIFVGFLIFFHIPDDPSKAWFLTEREKLMESLSRRRQDFGLYTTRQYSPRDPR